MSYRTFSEPFLSGYELFKQAQYRCRVSKSFLLTLILFVNYLLRPDQPIKTDVS